MISLQSRTEGGIVLQIIEAEIGKDCEPKLRLWCGTDNDRVEDKNRHYCILTLRST